MRAIVCAAAIAFAACRGGGRAHVATRAIVLPSIEARPASADDAIVAKVDGRPIYGSCVAAQAASLHEDRTRALDDCISFELLAGAAAARGVAHDPDVIDGYRQALVGRFLDVAFRDKYRTFTDLPASLRDPAFASLQWRMHRPEYRYSVYVRAVVGEKATPADEQAAHALMDQIYARVAGKKDLFPADLFAIAREVAGPRPIEMLTSPYGTGINGPGDQTYTRPLFALDAIGEVTPPSRTTWGWDLILWTDTMPALETSAEDLRAWMFPDLRRAWFERWIDELARADDADIVIDETRLKTMVPPDDDEPSSRTARPAGTP
jgi:hypothetical protein